VTDEQSLGRNCQIRGDCGKSLKFAEVAQIRELYESCDAREKFLMNELKVTA